MADRSKQRLIATCRCGQTGLELTGAPILNVICCCESCRTAGRQFEQVPGAPPVVRPDGGVDYCLYRKDRVKIVSGGEHLQERRLTAATPTRRVVATCCSTPVFVDFTQGHWLTIYRDRMPEGAPRPQARVMAKDRPQGTHFADDVPTYPTYPAGFMIRLLAAWAAMGFRRPRIAW